MTHLIDNKKFLCQHNKLHPLTAIKWNGIPETLYRKISSIVKNDSLNCGTPEGEEDLLDQELTNCNIDYDQYHFSDCIQLLCLDIKNKRKSLDKLYYIVETLNTNNEDIDKCCGVSTDFISKLTFFFIIIGEKASTNIPWSKMNRLKKWNADMCIWNHVLTFGWLSSVYW